MQKLLTAFIKTLSMEECAIGMKLKPEEPLAELLGVSTRQLREVFAALEEKGILIRRRGSGTFIKRRSDLSCDLETDGNAIESSLLSQIIPSIILDKRQDNALTVPHVFSAHRFHLQAWGDFSNTTGITTQHIYSGMLSQASRLGQILTIHPLVEMGIPISEEKIRQRIIGNPSDGYLLIGKYGSRFLNVCKSLRPKPILCCTIEPGMPVPCIHEDLNAAIEMAVHEMITRGRRKIAALFPSGEIVSPYIEWYKAVISSHGLAYCCSLTCNLQEDDIAGMIRQLFKDPQNCPDGLYVADDFLLHFVVKQLDELGIAIGRNLGVITLSNMHNPLPSQKNWSRVEFDPTEKGRRLVTEMLLKLEGILELQDRLRIPPVWIEGTTA